MKLFGGTRSKRVRHNQQPRTEERKRTAKEQAEIDEMIAAYQRYKWKKRVIVVSILAVVLLGGFLAWKLVVRPPEVITPTAKPVLQPTPTPASSLGAGGGQTAEPSPTPTPAARQRRENVYTFLLVGFDQNFGNTDTIMVGVYDADANTMKVLSIPRDTCANVASDESKNETKKINAIYSRAGIEGLSDAVSDFLGCPIDSYVTVSLRAFIQLVDTIGGVNFDVPHNMNYDDPTQDLHIHFNAGNQYLNGTNAMKVVRWRQNNDGTSYGDIDRINTQQNFLKTVIKQCLSLTNLTTNLDNYIDIFNSNVKTNMSTGNMVWYGKQFLKMSMEDIQFFTLPSNYNDSIKGFAYGTTLVDEWLQLLNEHFNVYDQPLTEADIDVISRDESGELYATSGEINGGYASFLDYDDYLVRLKAWNDYLAEQKAAEEAANNPPAETPAEAPATATTDTPAAPPLDTTETGSLDTGSGTEDMNGGA